MHDHQDSTISSAITYLIGAFAVWISQLNINDWLAICSLFVVIFRGWRDVTDYFVTRADKKALKNDRCKKND